jgi:hypothetical protein
VRKHKAAIASNTTAVSRIGPLSCHKTAAPCTRRKHYTTLLVVDSRCSASAHGDGSQRRRLHDLGVSCSAVGPNNAFGSRRADGNEGDDDTSVSARAG